MRTTVAVIALAVCGEASAAASGRAGSPQATFNPGFIHSTGDGIDLSRFERGNVTLPGVYQPGILVNGEPVPGSRDIVFRRVAGSESAQPCLDLATLALFGLDADKLARRGAGTPTIPLPADAALCGQIDRYVPGATIAFDDSEQQLRITVPQAFMASRARGYVSPALWDAGENAFMLSYNANTYRLRTHEGQTTSTFVGTQAGANLGGWRFRQFGSFTLRDGDAQWRNNQIYAQHDLTEARAQLTLGEIYTDGDILESVRLRGAAIVSDSRMLPASQRGYAPVIRGVAESNAEVTVRQNGYVIQSTSVAPGPFVIDDLYPTGYGSDLEVTVTEADGRTRTQRVPYTALPQMLRQGTTRFALWAGQVAETQLPDTPFVAQGTVQRGVSVNTTLYTGGTVSNSYAAALLGVAVNLPVGAFALDVGGSRAAGTDVDAAVRRGGSTRLRYTRSLQATGTNVGMAAHRFSTRHYLSVTDAARLRSRRRREDAPPVGGERNRFELTLAQPTPYGQLALTGAMVDYWSGRRRGLDYALSFASRWRTVTYNTSIQRSRIGDVFGQGNALRFGADTDTTFYLSLSMPLGAAPASPNGGLSWTGSGGSDQALLATLNGQVSGNEDLLYSLAATRHSTADGSPSGTASGNLTYRGSAGNLRGGASRGTRGVSQVSVGATGSVVAHRDGVTFARELGETNAIVHAPGAAGARIESHAGVRLDRHGNAVVRGLLPYQLNKVSIDTRGASHDVHLESTTEAGAPRAGALARLDYRTTVAQALLIRARHDGAPLPFGATVHDADDRVVGVVGQGSKIFARGELNGARLHVRWGEAGQEGCLIELPQTLDNLPEHGLHRAVTTSCDADPAS